MPPADTLALVAALADPAQRRDVARALAQRLGADDLLLFVTDPEMGVLLPAAGFPQTLPAGRPWRAFLAECVARGRCTAELPFPDASSVSPATGLASPDQSVLVLLGGSPRGHALAELCLLLPLLGAAFRGEQALVTATGHAAVAREAAARAEALAGTLDTTRRELHAALGEANAAGRQKDEFLAMLAHELRNPLGPIRNAVQLLKQLGPAEPRFIRAREIIERQIKQQARLLDDLLDVSRITQGKINLRPVRLDLVPLVRDTAEDARSGIESAGLTLELTLPEAPQWVDGDPTRLAQIVTNLLNNAAKFTDPGGTVGIQVFRSGTRAAGDGVQVPTKTASPLTWPVLNTRIPEHLNTQVAIVVRDTGIGIEPEMLPRVFEAFAQADRSLDRSRGGLGLGLALVKRLVELHGGQVWAESQGVGQGAAFILTFPTAVAAQEPRVPSRPAMSTGPIRVLIVEDNRDSAESLRDLLELSGCAVALAHSGSEALGAARQFRPEVILCDLGLPGMNGYQVAAQIREDPSLNNTQLIAVSGYGQEEDQQRSREAGFDRHLTKPVEFDELQRLLEVLRQHTQ